MLLVIQLSMLFGRFGVKMLLKVIVTSCDMQKCVCTYPLLYTVRIWIINKTCYFDLVLDMNSVIHVSTLFRRMTDCEIIHVVTTIWHMVIFRFWKNLVVSCVSLWRIWIECAPSTVVRHLVLICLYEMLSACPCLFQVCLMYFTTCLFQNYYHSMWRMLKSGGKLKIYWKEVVDESLKWSGDFVMSVQLLLICSGAYSTMLLGLILLMKRNCCRHMYNTAETINRVTV